MKKRRILFVDIDFVLNHTKETEDLSNDRSISDVVADDVPLCKDNILALKHIVENVEDLAIVWSSDWRLFDKDTYNNWKNPLKWLEAQTWIKDIVVGKTPKKMSSNRFEEIHFWFYENAYAKKHHSKEWMSKQYYDISNYVIIDDFDSPGMKRYGEHFFKCDHSTGLTMQQANNIVQYILKDNFKEKELDWSNHD